MNRQKSAAGFSETAADIQTQRREWRRKGWSIPELRGGKHTWFSLVQELVRLVGAGQVNDLDAYPDLSDNFRPQPWRSYVPFLRSIGLVSNQAGMLCLSEAGIQFCAKPDKCDLADLIQDKIRLFGEVLELLDTAPATV